MPDIRSEMSRLRKAIQDEIHPTNLSTHVSTALATAVIRPGTKRQPRPAIKRALQLVGLAGVAGGVAAKPVSAGIAFTTATLRGQALKRIHNRVVSRPGRFGLTFLVCLATGLARRVSASWAEEQPRLARLEAAGLVGRHERRQHSA